MTEILWEGPPSHEMGTARIRRFYWTYPLDPGDRVRLYEGDLFYVGTVVGAVANHNFLQGMDLIIRIGVTRYGGRWDHKRLGL